MVEANKLQQLYYGGGGKNACTNVNGLHSFREDLSQKHQEFVFIQRLSC